MTGPEFRALITRLGDAWTAGSAKAAAACFAEGVNYADPLRYRFATRESLLPFFEPPPGGHSTTWHRILFDEPAQVGAAEYTYDGHHRYHGAAIVEVDEAGLICAWREWQHVDDDLDWAGFVAGPDARQTAGLGG